MKYLRESYGKGNSLNKKYEDYLKSLTSKWEEVEMNSGCDFSLFYDKIIKCYNQLYTTNQFRPTNRDLEYTIDITYNSDYSRDNNDQNNFLSRNESWNKKNGGIKVKCNTGGVSGGSCWDESETQPYETGYDITFEDFKEFLGHILRMIYWYASDDDHYHNVNKILSKLESDRNGYVKENTYTNYEYYGNYDEYKVIYITLWDLYVFLSKSDML